jgi:signal transduction histidine kinase
MTPFRRLFLRSVAIALVVSTFTVATLFAIVVIGGFAPHSPSLLFAISAAHGAIFVPALLLLRRVAATRAKGLVDAMKRLARRDFSARLAAPPAAEFEVVKEGFSEMALALEAAEQKLTDADARRRRLFADLAHELATPASTILAIADTLAHPTLARDEDARLRWIAALSHEAQMLGRLVEDVRDLAALEDPDVSVVREPHALAPLLERVLRAQQVARGPAPSLVIDAPSPVCVDCDPDRLEQVVRNLLSNAARHTPPDGAITVTLSRDDAAHTAMILVEDSGVGVDEALLDRLGQRLFRVDPSRDRRTGGHGMGLAIARGIVARHGGSVRFERASSGGLRVVILLPCCDPPSEFANQ